MIKSKMRKLSNNFGHWFDQYSEIIRVLCIAGAAGCLIYPSIELFKQAKAEHDSFLFLQAWMCLWLGKWILEGISIKK